MRKRISSELKARASIEAIREVRPLNQIASDYEVHPNMLSAWKSTALKGIPSLFEKEVKPVVDKETTDQKIEELYAQIGRLTTQVSWLKKKSGIDLP